MSAFWKGHLIDNSVSRVGAYSRGRLFERTLNRSIMVWLIDSSLMIVFHKNDSTEKLSNLSSFYRQPVFIVLLRLIGEDLSHKPSGKIAHMGVHLLYHIII